MQFGVSMHNWMRDEPLEATLARLERCGYDGIELSGEPQRYDSARVRSLLDAHGLVCWGVVTHTGVADRDLIHPHASVRAAAVAYVRDCLTMAGELGGRILTLVPTAVGKVAPLASPDDERRWCVEGLRECQAHAEQVGVRIALEPLNRYESYFLNRCEQGLELADAVGGDFGLALDAFHMNIEEADLLGAIRAAGRGSRTSTWPTTTACRPARARSTGARSCASCAP